MNILLCYTNCLYVNDKPVLRLISLIYRFYLLIYPTFYCFLKSIFLALCYLEVLLNWYEFNPLVFMGEMKKKGKNHSWIYNANG